MDFCCCENSAKVDETPILLGKRINCQLCGLQRRPITALKRDEEIEGATAQYIEQPYKREEKQTAEHRKGSAWRVPITKAHMATRTLRNCGRCGLQKQQTDGAIETIRLGRVMRGSFGKHACGNMTRKVNEATGKVVRKSKANKCNSTNTDKLTTDCPSTAENISLPTLKSLTHTALTKRPHIIRLHLPQTQISDVTLNGEVLCANESLPLRTRVAQDPTTGAIRKRHSYMNFSEHKSKPLQPLNKILSDIVTKHSSRGEHFLKEAAEHSYEESHKYRAAGGFADAAECEPLIELPTFEQRTGVALHSHANSHRDLNLSEPDSLTMMTAAFYNSNEQQRFGDITSLISPKWLPYDFTSTPTTHNSSTLDTDVVPTPEKAMPACETNKCGGAVDAQPIFSVRSLVADQFGNNFSLCNKKLDTGQRSEQTAEIVFESRNNVAAQPNNSHIDENETSNADAENVLGGERRNITEEQTKFCGPLGFRKVHETCAHGSQAQLLQALPKSQQTTKPLKKCVQNAMKRPNASMPNKDVKGLEITVHKCQQIKKQPKRQVANGNLFRKAVIAKEKRLCYGPKRLPLIENSLSKETSLQQKQDKNQRRPIKTTLNEAEKSHLSQAVKRKPSNNLPQSHQNTNAIGTKSALETLPTVTRSRDFAVVLRQPVENVFKPTKVSKFKNLSPRMKRLIGIQAPQHLERITSKLQRQNVETKYDVRLASRMQSEVEQKHQKRLSRETIMLSENQSKNISRDALAVPTLKPNNTKQYSLNKSQQVLRSIKKPLAVPIIQKLERSQSNKSEHVMPNYQNRNAEKFPSNDMILKKPKPLDDGLQSSAINRETSKLSLILEVPKVSIKNDYEAKQTVQESPGTSSEPQTDSLLRTIDFYNFLNDAGTRCLTLNSKVRPFRRKTVIVRKMITNSSTDSNRSTFRKRLASGMTIKPRKLKYKQGHKKESAHNNKQLSKDLTENKLAKKEKKMTAEKVNFNENENGKLQESKLSKVNINQNKTDLIQSHSFHDISSCSDSFKTLSKLTTTQILGETNREKSLKESENQKQKTLSSNTNIKKSKKVCLASLKVSKQPLTSQKSIQSVKKLKALDLINQHTTANVQPAHNQGNLKSFGKTKELNAYEDELIAQFIPEEKLFKNEPKTENQCTICTSRYDSCLSVPSGNSKSTEKVRNSSRKSKNKTISQDINKKNYIKHLKIKSYKLYKKPTCKRMKSFQDLSTGSSQSLTKLAPHEETTLSSSSLTTNDRSLLKQPRPYYFEFRMPDVEPRNVTTYVPHSAQSLKSELPDANWFEYYENYISKDASLKGVNSDFDCENGQESQKSDCGAFSMNEYLPIPCYVHNCNALLTPSGLLAHYAHEHCHWYGAYAKFQCQSICHGAARHIALNVNQLPSDQIQYVGILAYAGVRGEKSLVERNLCTTSVLLPAHMQELAQSLPVVILACKLSNSVLLKRMNIDKAFKSEVILENPKNQIVVIWAAAYSLPYALQLKMTIYDKNFLCSRMQVMCVRYFHKASQDPYEFIASKKDYLLLTYADLQLLTQDFKTDLRLDVVLNEL